jgi:hypothetical protein
VIGVFGDLPFEAVTPVVAVQRRPYGSDGYRDEAHAEPVKSKIEESSFESLRSPTSRCTMTGKTKEK